MSGLAALSESLGLMRPQAEVTAARRIDVAVQAAEPARPATPRKLTKEQETLAQFLAKRYRVALDSTQEFVDHAYRVAKDLKLDPWLILAIMGIESSFDPNAISHKGAQGLMQVLTRVHAEKFAPFGGVTAAFDPLSNIKVGAKILKDYIDRDGSIEAALKSYVGAAFLSDDRGYGEKVLTERERLAAIAEGRPMTGLPSRNTSEKLTDAAAARLSGPPAIAESVAAVARADLRESDATARASAIIDKAVEAARAAAEAQPAAGESADH